MRKADQVRELDARGVQRADIARRLGISPRKGARFARHPPWSIENRLSGRRVRLLEVIDLADMLRRMRQLEADALTIPAGRKLTTLDHRHLVGMSACAGSCVIA
jgi:hypothetical protein